MIAHWHKRACTDPEAIYRLRWTKEQIADSKFKAGNSELKFGGYDLNFFDSQSI